MPGLLLDALHNFLGQWVVDTTIELGSVTHSPIYAPMQALPSRQVGRDARQCVHRGGHLPN